MTTRTAHQGTEILANTMQDATAATVVGNYARAAVSPTEITVKDDEDEALELRLYGLDREGAHHLVETVDLERYRDEPRGRTGAIKVTTPAALVTYANRHLDEHCSTLWGDIDKGLITVVLNDHANGELENVPGWADHRVELQMQRSPEWKAWAAINGQPQTNVDLALFLEEHMLEIVEPDGSTLLEVTQTFHATTGAVFKSSQRLDSGEQRLVYEEDIQAQAGRNQQVEIPTDLTLAIRPWLGVDPVAVKAKFRFRIREGHLVLFVSLLNLEDVSRTAVENSLHAVGDQLDLLSIEGIAPAARR